MERARENIRFGQFWARTKTPNKQLELSKIENFYQSVMTRHAHYWCTTFYIAYCSNRYQMVFNLVDMLHSWLWYHILRCDCFYLSCFPHTHWCTILSIHERQVHFDQEVQPLLATSWVRLFLVGILFINWIGLDL